MASGSGFRLLTGCALRGLLVAPRLGVDVDDVAVLSKAVDEGGDAPESTALSSASIFPSSFLTSIVGSARPFRTGAMRSRTSFSAWVSPASARSMATRAIRSPSPSIMFSMAMVTLFREPFFLPPNPFLNLPVTGSWSGPTSPESLALGSGVCGCEGFSASTVAASGKGGSHGAGIAAVLSGHTVRPARW